MERTWKFYFKDKQELEKFIKEGPENGLPSKVQETLKKFCKKNSVTVLGSEIHQLSVDENTGKYTQSTASTTNKAGTYEVE